MNRIGSVRGPPREEPCSRRCENCRQEYHGTEICPQCGDYAGSPFVQQKPICLPKQRVHRACMDCPATWTGALNCPTCGAPGEPQEPRGRGQPPKPHGTARNAARGGCKWVAVLSGEEAFEVEAARREDESRADLLLRLVRGGVPE